MDWTDTPESSNVRRYKYDAANRVLTVEFQKGGVYEYFEVSDLAFDGLRNAPSKGQFLAQQIKGHHRYARA